MSLATFKQSKQGKLILQALKKRKLDYLNATVMKMQIFLKLLRLIVLFSFSLPINPEITH